MVKTYIYFSALVYLIFMGLVGTGIYFTDPRNETASLVLIGVFCFFGVMLIYSLLVWKVTEANGILYLKRFFGFQRIKLQSTDLQNAKGFVNWDPEQEVEKGRILELKTAKGTFRFDSNYYTDFDLLLHIVLKDRRDLLHEYHRSLVKNRKRVGNLSIIYTVVVIGILIFMYLRN